jgi:hypothetical protein
MYIPCNNRTFFNNPKADNVDSEVEEAEEVGVEAAEELAEAVSTDKRDRPAPEKRSSLSSLRCQPRISDQPVSVQADRADQPVSGPSVHVEGAKFKNLCNLLNIDDKTFGIHGWKHLFTD